MSAHELAATRERDARYAFAELVTNSGVSLVEFALMVPDEARASIALALANWHARQGDAVAAKQARAMAWVKP